MHRSLKYFLVLVTFLASPLSAQIFTDQAEFETTCPGLPIETFSNLDFEFFDNAGIAIPTFTASPEPDDFDLFSLNVTDENEFPPSVFASFQDADLDGVPDGDIPTIAFSSQAFNPTYTFDLNGPATSFGFGYLGLVPATIELLDADGNIIVTDNLVVSELVPELPNFWGFTGTEEIAQVRVTTSDGFNIAANVVFANISAGNCEPIAEPSCFDQIALIKGDLAALIADSDGNAHELHKLENAFACLCIMEDPIFWQDDFTRLSYYGSNFFLGGAYTIAWLEASGNAGIDPIIDDIIGLLECIVDNEIEYAIANGGHDCFIHYAEAYADVADQLYEDVDLPIVSALAYRLAWLHAFYSTY